MLCIFELYKNKFFKFEDVIFDNNVNVGIRKYRCYN